MSSRNSMNHKVFLWLCVAVHCFISNDVQPFMIPSTTNMEGSCCRLMSQHGSTCTSWILRMNKNRRSHRQHKYHWQSALKMSNKLHVNNNGVSKATTATTRCNFIDAIKTGVVVITAQYVLSSMPVSAKPDCYTDCYKNCIALAPKDTVYCSESCTEYCNQDDRQDGLSGSISSDKGEVGILGGAFGSGTVVKGQDKPPNLAKIPGLDFTSGSGKKMIGY